MERFHGLFWGEKINKHVNSSRYSIVLLSSILLLYQRGLFCEITVECLPRIYIIHYLLK